MLSKTASYEHYEVLPTMVSFLFLQPLTGEETSFLAGSSWGHLPI